MVKISGLSALSGEIPTTALIEAELANGDTVKLTIEQFAELSRDTIFAALRQAGVITITQDDAGNTITISATGGGGGGGGTSGPLMHGGYMSGSGYPTYEQSTQGNMTPSGDTMMLIPVASRFDVVINAFLLRCSVGAAGAAVKAARYSLSDGVATNLLAEATAPLVLTTDNTVVAAEFAANPTLSASAPSYLALLFNAAASGAQLFAQSPADPRARAWFGSRDIGAFGIGNVTATLTVARAYADGFPATFPTFASTPALATSTASPPMAWFRKA